MGALCFSQIPTIVLYKSNRLSYNTKELKQYKPRNFIMPRFNKEICRYIDNVGKRRKFRGVRGKNKNKNNRLRKFDCNFGVHTEHLISLNKKTTTYNNNRNIKISLVNARSLKKKIYNFLHDFLENSYDLGFITETWLKDSDTAEIEELNSNNLTFLNYQRNNNKTGGIGLIFKKDINIKEIETGDYESFEFASWTPITKERKIFMSYIYRTPYSATHPITTTKFFDDFSEYLSEKILTHGSILITGNFNIHHEDLDDPDKLSLDDLLNTFSYKQLVKCVTHISRHSVDLILTREQDDLITLNPEQSQLLSNQFLT